MNRNNLLKLGLNTFISIDVETTGLDVQKDKIIEISACKYTEGKLQDSYTQLINPNTEINSFISNLTGIKNSDLKDQPLFNEISDDLIKFIEGVPLVGHNIMFDLNFINKELKNGYDIFSEIFISDTYYLAKVFLFYLESFKLSSLCEKFNFKINQSHRAEDDAKNTALLFIEILQIIQNTNINFLSKVNRCINDSDILNKILMKNIIQKLINDNKNNFDDNFYLNKVPKSSIYINQENNCKDLNIDDIFSKEGLLSKKINGYELRKNQYHFTSDCMKNINDQGLLIAEADTGIGKSFSYLVAILLENNKKNVISSSTHNLQNQLFYKDLPLIASSLGIKTKASIMKGMDNYLCNDRLNKVLDQIDKFLTNDERLEIQSVIIWSSVTNTGDINECNSFRKRNYDKIWKLIKYEPEICLFNNSSSNKNCFYKKLQNESKNSNILVVNHSLLASSYEKQDNFINDNTNCFIDEAHKFLENFRDQLKENISCNSIQSNFDNIILLFNKIVKDRTNNVINEKYQVLTNNINEFSSLFNQFSLEYGNQILNKNNKLKFGKKIDTKYVYCKREFENLSIISVDLSVE